MSPKSLMKISHFRAGSASDGDEKEGAKLGGSRYVDQYSQSGVDV
jgi:hypothetical protein